MNLAVFSRKRGQETGGGPATLVIIIIILIVLYIVMLPAEDREDLLGEGDDNEGDSDIVDDNMTLLKESPGRLDYTSLDEFTHHIDAFTLYRTTESSEIRKENPFVVRNGWFDNKRKVISFSLDDIENTENMILSFTASKYKGLLIIKFNGELIFESQLTKTYVDPIAIDKDLIREENVVEIEVSSVGWAFWSTNEYNIESFKIIADLTDVTRQESTNVFVVTAEEKNNLDKSKIKFNPDCMPNDVGVLEIFLNNNKVFSGIPDCGILNTKEFSTGYIDEGQNTLVFKTNRGSYIIDQIKVVTELEDIIYPFYYFEINESVYEEFEDGVLDIELTLLFFDDDEYKKASIYVNGHKTHMNTYESKWTKTINNHVVEGTNAIKIEPKTALDLIELKVEAVE